MPEKLGEYRRVREIGRGGMGIVYEAVQESLGRRVALKVLPTHAVMHPTYLARFRREAKAAARLHHTNIVPVFGVGDQDGIHFYAMQHIQGQGLDQVLKEVRRLREAHAASTLARGTADSGEPRATQGTAVETDSSLTALAPSSSWSKSDAPYCAAVARLGVQAADALAYAHEHGVLHRDIKPSNLLLDTHGTLWVSDFGLAKTDDLDALTDTGDLVGTLRYMAPERLTHGSDARGDVYSLGATLYEMLTLRPAFEERDRGRLIRQVAQEEPPRPRKLAPHVPLDLETIVLKAMAKHPSHRYVSAAEMAEDLRRFLADRPIKAHRTRPWEHVRRWAARNPALAGTGSVAVLALVTGLLLTGWQWRRAETHFTAMTQAYQQAKRSGEEAQAATEKRQMQQVVLTREVARGLEESVRWQAQENWPEARAAVVRAAGFLSSGQGSEGLQQRVTERRKDLEMVHKLQEIRLGMSNVRNDGFAFADTDAGYALAFREYGIDVLSLSFEESAARLSSRSVAQELAVALDDWAVVGNANQRWKELLALAAAIDPDAWRNRFREVRRQGDYTGLKALADSEEVGQLPASTLQNLGSILLDSGAVEEALALLRQAQHRFPHDFWVNYTLAEALRAASPPHWSEAVRYYTVARALRRQSPGVNVNLGAVLAESGSVEEAIAMFREAVRLQPDYGAAHYNLGTALSASGSADEAVVELQESVRLRPRYPEGFCNLGSALKAQGKPDAAISAFRTALDLKSDHLTALTQLGAVLFDNSRFEEAVVVFRRAIQVSPDDAGLHLRLGDALQELARLAEAISAFRDAIRLLPDSALAYSRLGSALVANKSLDEGIAALREAIRLAPERSVGHYNLGNALKTKPSFDEAIAAYREAVRLKPDDFQSWNNLGQALRGKGSVDEAIAAFREALRVKPDHVAALINLGDVLRTKGQAEEAVAVLRQAVGLDPNQASARTNLGAALRLMGDLEGAIAEYREAIRLQPDLVAAHSNLGSALRLRGNLEEALLALREAIRLQPDHAEAHCNLGLTLRAQGHFTEALAALERGHELGSRRRGWTFPSARWVQETRHSVELDQKLPGVLKGAYKPSAAECLQFAQICDAKRLTAAAARLYQAAFEQQPEAAAHTKTHYRYQAARTAAQAGCGQGQDAGELSEQDRSRWRGQAFEWLRADLAHWTDAASDTDGMPSRSTLLQWQRDPALAALREPDSIAKLPPVEQDPWRRFWQDVATVLAKAQPSANRPPQLR